MLEMLMGLPRALRYRKVLSPAVEKMQALLELAADTAAHRPERHAAENA
jgi:hypothetical protein